MSESCFVYKAAAFNLQAIQHVQLNLHQGDGWYVHPGFKRPQDFEQILHYGYRAPWSIAISIYKYHNPSTQLLRKDINNAFLGKKKW